MMNTPATIRIVNPFSGSIVERDTASYSQRDADLFASRMDDAEAYATECACESVSEWIANMVAKLGQVRAGQIILS